jgi:hypothetical protein
MDWEAEGCLSWLALADADAEGCLSCLALADTDAEGCLSCLALADADAVVVLPLCFFLLVLVDLRPRCLLLPLADVAFDVSSNFKIT